MGMMVPIHTVLVPVAYVIGALNLKNNIPALIMIYIAFNLPFSIMVITNFMRGVNRSLEEAASLMVQVFSDLQNVVLPMTSAGNLYNFYFQLPG